MIEKGSVHFKRGSPTAELIMSKFSSAGQMLHELRPKCDCQTGTTVRIFSLWVQIEVGIAVPSLVQLCRTSDIHLLRTFSRKYRGDFNSLASCQFVAVRRDEVDVTSKDVRTFGRADIHWSG